MGPALVSWTTAGVGVYRLFPFAFHALVSFHSLFFICHWISFVFLLYNRLICTHSVEPLLTHFLGEFPGLGLALVPDVVVPEEEHGCHGAEISIQILPWPGFEPRTLAMNVTTRRPLPPQILIQTLIADKRG